MDPRIHLRSQPLDILARGKRLTDKRIEYYERQGFYGPDRQRAAKLREVELRARRLPPLTAKEIRKRYAI